MPRESRDRASTALAGFAVVLLGIFVSSACTSSGGGGLPASDGGPQAPTGNSPEVALCERAGYPCATGTVCDPFAGCVQCVFDRDCAAGQWCHNSVCETAVPCTRDMECGSPGSALAACDPSRGACVPCLTDAHCGPYAHCTDGACKPYQPCVNSFDCAAGLVCDRAVGECFPCVGNGDCPENSVCLHHACRPKCDSDNTCVALNQLCDPLGGCTQCVTDADCPDVYHCDLGQCIRDACLPNSSVCDPDTFGTFTCQADGRGYVASLCPSGTSCDVSKAAACVAWACSPGLTTCSADSRSVIRCGSNGLTSATVQTCASDEVCSSGACLKVICTPGLSFCDTVSSKATCNGDGTGGTNPQSCSTGNHCSAGVCVANSCIPNSVTCAGNTVRTCDSIGSGYLSTVTDCAASGQVCSGGACLSVVCTANAYYCGTDNNVYHCNTLGTASTLYSTCNSQTSVCIPLGSNASCAPIVCTPGDPICDIDRLTTCNATGTGPVSTGGTDCTASGDACYGGACLPKICPGTSMCSGGNVVTCTNRGTSTTAGATCLASQYCSVTSGVATCKTDVCSTGQQGCLGQVTGVCNADGSGYDGSGTDCSLSNSLCVNGSCLPIICTANATYCQGGNVYRCGSNGTTSSLYATCSTAQYCSTTSSTTASCATDVCTAGAATCNGNIVSTCLADGSGPDPTVNIQDCTATGQACDSGICKNIICTPNQTFCSGTTVQLCNALGTASTTSTTCSSNQYCSPTGSSGRPGCVTDICNQGQPACDGETLATCNSDGSGYTSLGTDCSLTAQVCNQVVACAAAAMDTYGGSTSSSSPTASSFLGDAYLVSTSRTLTSIESYLTIAGTYVLTWVVYEGSAPNTSFSLISQTTTTGGGTATFLGSGPISVPLSAGKYYAIGVYVSGGTYTNFYQILPSAKYTSFGMALGGATISGSTPPVSAIPTIGTIFGSAPYQRLTTTL